MKKYIGKNLNGDFVMSITIMTIYFLFAVVAQLIERQTSTLQVAGLSPVYRSIYDPVAQLVEHLTSSDKTLKNKRLLNIGILIGSNPINNP